MRAIASETSGNMRRGPVWKSSGSSALIRNWLNVKPPGAASATQVEKRKMPSESSWVSVFMVGSPGLSLEAGSCTRP